MALRTKFSSVSNRNRVEFLVGFLAYIAFDTLIYLFSRHRYMGIIFAFFAFPIVWIPMVILYKPKRWVAYGIFGGYILNLIGITIWAFGSKDPSAFSFISYAIIGAPVLPFLLFGF